MADQGISSLSNFVLGILVARSLDPKDLGAFTLAYATFSFAISASRGTSTDPLVVRYSGTETPEWARAVGSATGTAALNGVVAGAICVVAGLLLPAEVGHGFIALGIGLPGILLQDSYRFAFFSVGKASFAFVNDLAWAVLQIGALAILAATGSLTVVTSLGAFGATAAIAATFGYLQCGLIPRPLRTRTWLVDTKALGGRYLIENLGGGVARLLRISIVGFVAGLAAVGLIRAADIMAGPFGVLLAGVGQVAVPEARQVLARTPDRFVKFCLWLASGQALGATIWSCFALMTFPLGLGELLVGKNWGGAQALLVPTFLTLVLTCFVLGASSGVRALAASRRSLPAQLASDGLFILGGGLGAMIAGAAGSCWGVAISAAISIVVWWRQLRRAFAEHVDKTSW